MIDRVLLGSALFAVVACSPGTSPSPSISIPSTAPASGSPATSPAASQSPAASEMAGVPAPADLGGTWLFEATNPRVVSATGEHAGGSVVLSGDRYVFSAGDYRSEGPAPFVGPITLDCTTAYCRFDRVPLVQLRVVGDGLALVDPATLTPLGSFGGRCGWTDIPGGGGVRVLSTDGVRPTTIAFVAGTAGGVGAECETGGHVVAWDVTATR